MIKYLCRPEDGSSYQRGANLQCRWELRSETAISQIKLGKSVGLNATRHKNIKKYNIKMLFCNHATKLQHIQVSDMNNQAHLIEIRCGVLHCVSVNQYSCPHMLALGTIQTLNASEKKRARSTLSALCRWPLSQQKIFHQRQFLAMQISSYGTLALDLPQLKPERPVSTHTLFRHRASIHTSAFVQSGLCHSEHDSFRNDRVVCLSPTQNFLIF